MLSALEWMGELTTGSRGDAVGFSEASPVGRRSLSLFFVLLFRFLCFVWLRTRRCHVKFLFPWVFFFRTKILFPLPDCPSLFIRAKELLPLPLSSSLSEVKASADELKTFRGVDRSLETHLLCFGLLLDQVP